MKAAKTTAIKGKQATEKAIKNAVAGAAAKVMANRNLDLHALAKLGDLPCGKYAK